MEHSEKHVSTVAECRGHGRDSKVQEALVQRLSRIEGQIRGIKGMIENEVYCDDVLNQIAAARAALTSAAKLLLEDHIRGCVAERIRHGNDDVMDELLKTIGKLV